MIAEMDARMRSAEGFIAALDQSGGSTPGALAAYGIPQTAYHDDDGMFALMHDMRARVITAPAFSRTRILAAILFERTMEETVLGQPVPTYLWRTRGIVPVLKVDKGLLAESDGVRLMKPITGLEDLLARAAELGVFGTKMRSVVNLASPSGISAIVKQQFELARTIVGHGLMPIIEPEVLVASPQKAGAEAALVAELTRNLDELTDGVDVMLKVTIPETPDLYAGLAAHPRVARVVALSGGYERTDACTRLARNHGMIASFSRALLDDLRVSMDDATFDATLAEAIDEIYRASTVKE
ncbi:fructose bisphosphate aldolase [Sphingomonas glacialis]|uniref:fructose-bisphosphate aldolase n=2 Tax=Sphingomonas glacialis TaxID=658225 RepID=A0A502FRW5_9SPHN|nr:fructose bisphosphate aldolase [Sphingomonas glacialis]